MKDTLRILAIVGASTLASLLFAALLNRAIDFFFLSMILSGGLALVLFRLFFRLWRREDSSPNQVSMLGSLLSASLTLLILFAGPLQVDRSISVWLLSHVKYHNALEEAGSLGADHLSDEFNYFVTQKDSEFMRRYQEQISLGNLLVDDKGAISLSQSGHFITQLFTMTQEFFATEPRYVAPKPN